MLNQNLLDYIKQELQKGIPLEQIKQTLITNGWKDNDVDSTIISIQNPETKQNTIEKEPTLPDLNNQTNQTNAIPNNPSTQINPETKQNTIEKKTALPDLNNQINQPSKPTNKKKIYVKITLIIFFLIILIGGAVFFFLREADIPLIELEDTKTQLIEENELDTIGPKESWLKMRAEFDNIKSYDDLEEYTLKFGSKQNIAEFEENKQQIEMIQDDELEAIVTLLKGISPKVDEITNITEELNDKTATLYVEFEMGDIQEKTPLKVNTHGECTINLVLENNLWKIENSHCKL